ncbi:hypothetical protein CDCA_CDCA19G4735 [Cyanidium caldarium]|uniref:Myb-like domain-containing protein n=1 Tax=Cyanidium caldarium TaxID=2771 RepID=A0AAV9J311_CYACA|nr:hypothetical protein CDCA_CDCA19G4735 [Cyanidium caldarium]
MSSPQGQYGSRAQRSWDALSWAVQKERPIGAELVAWAQPNREAMGMGSGPLLMPAPVVFVSALPGYGNRPGWDGGHAGPCIGYDATSADGAGLMFPGRWMPPPAMAGRWGMPGASWPYPTYPHPGYWMVGAPPPPALACPPHPHPTARTDSSSGEWTTTRVASDAGRPRLSRTSSTTDTWRADGDARASRGAMDKSPPRRSRSNYVRFTECEERLLLEGVALYGIGHWKRILHNMDGFHPKRTPMNLKDKFRNILRARMRQAEASGSPANTASLSAVSAASGTDTSAAAKRRKWSADAERYERPQPVDQTHGDDANAPLKTVDERLEAGITTAATTDPPLESSTPHVKSVDEFGELAAGCTPAAAGTASVR